jgi:hypothetical protein
MQLCISKLCLAMLRQYEAKKSKTNSSMAKHAWTLEIFDAEIVDRRLRLENSLGKSPALSGLIKSLYF